ncbi:MAG: isochorismatase family cysteine hydrolase [Terrimicrobiaceae bacterium]|nr:isochorismatase family cysteine hydrolase [Terrimicrobiaceae bacterium]
MSNPPGGKSVLILIDVINDLDFPQGRALLRHAMPAARRIVTLKKRARAAGIPVVYVNDNFGRWRSDFRHQVEYCLRESCLGRHIAAMLAPEESDYFVLKPKHSAFFQTSLDILLEHLGAQRLILTGFAGNICVLYTANDAYMRDYQIVVPRDAIASESAGLNTQALTQMKRYLRAETPIASKVRFGPE